ncbi:MAG TPA: hypothetical protein H9683_03360 [Firmicutes bacterium]|nr:hypothetical protein [Bacillota bacterium]
MAHPAGKGFFSVKKCGRHLDMHPIHAIMDIKILPGAMMAKREGKKGKKLKYNGVLFSKNYKRYLAYWESIRDKFPKEFAEAYWGTKFSDLSHFHDYKIFHLSMKGNYVNTFMTSADTIEMLIGKAAGFYELTFSKIHKVSCCFDVPKNGASEHLLTDIVNSLIGISKDGNYIFEFATANRGSMRIEFEEIRVVEHALNSYVHQQQSED